MSGAGTFSAHSLLGMFAITEAEKLARFVESSEFEDLSSDAIDQLKIRVLDSLGVAIGALEAEPIRMLRDLTDELGGHPLAAIIGGGRTSPDRAAFINGALIRYLDFNDSFLAKNETCHPSDNIAPVLAAAEYANSSGRDFLTALAVAYQVQTRLSDVAPVRSRGFDHTTQGAYAVAAGVSKALGLDARKTANAIAMSGTANNALRVTRTGKLSHWKGLAYPHTAFSGTFCALLAMRGITGPLEVFEGNKGFKESIAGSFELPWESETLEGVTRTVLKKYNAEVHSQSAIELILDLKRTHGFTGDEIDRIDLTTFQVAYDIIGGGEEGEKKQIRTKEEADHSLPYLIAVAILDGEVLPKQYRPERIVSADVQMLLQRVFVRPDSELSSRFPEEMPAHVRVLLRNGGALEAEQSTYEGFLTLPMSWSAVERKFEVLASPFTSPSVRHAIIDVVRSLEKRNIQDLTQLFSDLSFNFQRSA